VIRHLTKAKHDKAIYQGAGSIDVIGVAQTINAVRHSMSKHFSRGFLIVAPGITIKDRLRVLLPNDPESYYRHREIVPPDMLADLGRAPSSCKRIASRRCGRIRGSR